MYDIATKWREIVPSGDRNVAEAIKALRFFAGPDNQIKSSHSDSAPELRKAAEALGWCHYTSVLYVSRANGIVERQMRVVEEGTRTILSQAGLGPKWWPLASK